MDMYIKISKTTPSASFLLNGLYLGMSLFYVDYLQAAVFTFLFIKGKVVILSEGTCNVTNHMMSLVSIDSPKMFGVVGK